MIGRFSLLVFYALLTACTYTKSEQAMLSYCPLRQQALKGDPDANVHIRLGLETRGYHGERSEIAWPLEPSIADREYTYLLKTLVARDVRYRNWLSLALSLDFGRWPQLVDHSRCIDRAAAYPEVDACLSDQAWWIAVDITQDLPCPLAGIPPKS